ncbi:hypothetical protein [Vibrio sp. WXL103]|uniref:hypothetical protein n=1 Tax=unclassified Vibrio TaxID=2614977 RepID=UPI003EC84A44
MTNNKTTSEKVIVALLIITALLCTPFIAVKLFEQKARYDFVDKQTCEDSEYTRPSLEACAPYVPEDHELYQP